MAIVSSTIADVSPQVDGRNWVHEVHTDQFALTHDRNYLANAGANLNTAMSAYAVVLDKSLTDSEMAGNIDQLLTNGRAAVLTLVYTTMSQLMNTARPMYATATGVAATNLGDWFNTRSYIELQQAFNFASVSAYNNFKNQFFVPNANAATSVRTATGG